MQITESERVYRLLKDEIMNGTRPPGSQLSQESIAASTKTSRTPAREAVVRLAADGLVRLTPGYGATVSEISLRDFLEVNYLRWILEGHAAQLAAATIPTEVVESYAAELLSMQNQDNIDPGLIADIDQRIHRAIASHCGNRRLDQLIEQLNAVNAIARSRDVARRSTSMIASLREIVDALSKRDGGLARNLMQAHIQEFSAALQSIFDWPGDDSSPPT
jgi:DNA-binding GntR family transcriptional regulator